MYHTVRSWHRWAGLIASIFLLLISATGFLLATKGTFGWVRPPERDGAQVESLAQVVTLHEASQAAFALGMPELRTREDIDRIDYRPAKNMFKIVSKRGYKEVQVDGASGKVLQVANRNDQLTEDIHDLSFFADRLHDFGLPAVAVLLFFIASTGLVVFSVPVVRRWRHARRRKQASLDI